MPKAVHQETLCGHKRCCPTVTIFEDGSMRISDNDSEKGSVGDIKLEPEQVTRLVELANKKKK
jgi:hypothetical protein